MNILRAIVVVGIRIAGIYFFWLCFLGLKNFYFIEMAVLNRTAASANSDQNILSAIQLQTTYGSALNQSLADSVLGYALLDLLIGVLLCKFSIPLARLLTRNIESV